jgi:hypothetical protein
MTTPVTASMLYDLVTCPHRVTMHLYGDPAMRDEPNKFVQLLWEKGSLYEREVIAALALPFLDLSKYAGDEKERLTLEAMQRGEPLIYSGRIQESGLLGDPDLLRKETGGHVVGDIKSGAGEEGPEDDATPKLHYPTHAESWNTGSPKNWSTGTNLSGNPTNRALTGGLLLQSSCGGSQHCVK